MQRQVEVVTAALADRGYDVHVACGDGTLELASSVTSHVLPTFTSPVPFSFSVALRRLSRTLRPHVVHGHGTRLAPALALAPADLRFVSCHGLEPERVAAAARMLRAIRVPVISCGEGPRRQLAAHGVVSRVLNNATPPLTAGATRTSLNSEFDLAPDAVLCVLPARFSAQKDHAALIDTLVRARRLTDGPVPTVLCFGDGPLRDVVIRRASQQLPAGTLRCLPYRPDASSLMAASDFFLLTSRWEGQPQVVIEALARNLPVASLTRIGLEDLVIDGRNGRLTTSVDELARVVAEWTTTPSSRLRDETVSGPIVAAHELFTVVSAYEDVYSM